MSNLVVKEQQEFMGVRIPVIEGGFGEGQKVILAKTVAKIHGYSRGVAEVNDLIKDNIGRFNKNDVINLLKSSELFRDFAKENDLIGSNRTQDVFLLSERGYTKLVSMMDNSNDKKWEVMDKLIDEYFSMRAKQKNASTLDIIKLQTQALEEFAEKIEQVDKKIDEKFEEIPIFVAEKKEIIKLVNRKVVGLLGGKSAPAYKPYSKKVFSDLYGQVHREFNIPATDCIKRKNIQKAKDVVTNYKLPDYLYDEISIMNNQIRFN